MLNIYIYGICKIENITHRISRIDFDDTQNVKGF